MKTSEQEYRKMSKQAIPPSPLLTNCLKAFLIGGLICALGQSVSNLAASGGLPRSEASLCGSLTLIFLSVLLTGLHVYDNIAKHAGAGTLVPITGFANAIASPALEFKSEGYVLGLGAKIFTIAGPVLLYGMVASVVYGLIYYLTVLLR